MLEKSINEMTRSALLREWMDSLGGNVATGACKLKSVKISKKGSKLTIVLKKKKQAAPRS
ncbi:MAG: hypothetical protein WAK03_15015 [Methylocystis sp.]